MFSKSPTMLMAFIALFSLFSTPALAQASSSVVAQALPNPTADPKFDYNFKISFEGGKCSQEQRVEIVGALQNAANIYDRLSYWGKEFFHEWHDEIDYWFGDNPETQEKYIKSAYNQRLFTSTVG